MTAATGPGVVRWGCAQPALCPPSNDSPGRSLVMARINPKTAVATVFVAAMFINIIDATVVNVALPTNRSISECPSS